MDIPDQSHQRYIMLGPDDIWQEGDQALYFGKFTWKIINAGNLRIGKSLADERLGISQRRPLLSESSDRPVYIFMKDGEIRERGDEYLSLRGDSPVWMEFSIEYVGSTHTDKVIGNRRRVA